MIDRHNHRETYRDTQAYLDKESLIDICRDKETEQKQRKTDRDEQIDRQMHRHTGKGTHTGRNRSHRQTDKVTLCTAPLKDSLL